MKVRFSVILALLSGVALPLSNSAQTTTTNRPIHKEHRYLLIVETSKAMGKRSDGISQTILNAIGSGFRGEVKRGDSLGVWMYNEALIAGKVPLQKYGSDNQAQVATMIVQFLEKQKFEKNGFPETFVPSMVRVLTNSPLITVMVISSGLEDVHGTGFDDRINANYKQWRDQQQQKKLPFITLLRARKGVLIDCVVSPAPWGVDLPPLPPEPAPVAAVKPPASRNAALRPSTNSPGALYFSGKKAESHPVTSTNVIVPQAQLAAVVQPVQTNLAPAVEKASNGTVAAVSSAGGTNSPAATNITAVTASAGTSLPAPKPGPTTNSTPAHMFASTLPAAPSSPQPFADQSVSAPQQPSTSAPGVVKTTPGSDDSASNAVLSANPAPPVTRDSTRSSAPVSGAGFPWGTFMFGAACCLVTAAIMALLHRFFRTRAHQTQHISLITRSLERGE